MKQPRSTLFWIFLVLGLGALCSASMALGLLASGVGLMSNSLRSDESTLDSGAP